MRRFSDEEMSSTERLSSAKPEAIDPNGRLERYTVSLNIYLSLALNILLLLIPDLVYFSSPCLT